MGNKLLRFCFKYSVDNQVTVVKLLKARVCKLINYRCNFIRSIIYQMT